MKEVVECLSELSKLVPVHSWNGLANPCLMVETAGVPVQSRSSQVNSNGTGGENGILDDGDAKLGKPLRNPRRVYSDLGFRSNLMELMASPDGESEFHGEDDGFESKLEPTKRVLSFRFESGRFIGGTSIRSMVLGKDRVSKLKPNQSVQESSSAPSGMDDKITTSSSVTQAAELAITA